jgi:hypothetical protein
MKRLRFFYMLRDIIDWQRYRQYTSVAGPNNACKGYVYNLE